MNIVIVSMFRNSTGYIDTYIRQMEDLNTLLISKGHKLSLILGYGDSTDGTGEMLFEECSYRFPCILQDVSHGGEEHGSYVDPERFKRLSVIANNLWALIPEYADIVGVVESDLIVSGETLASLVDDVEAHRSRVNGSPCYILSAPMIYTPDGRFYDTWAFTANGVGFNNKPPYHPFLSSEGKYASVDSVGSVAFMNGDLARKLHWPEEDVFRGFCREAKQLGAEIYVNKSLKAVHP